MVAGFALFRVMLPVWLASPIVTVPPVVVKMRESSVVVRLMPATGVPLVPPISNGRDSTEDWMVTVAVDGAAH